MSPKSGPAAGVARAEVREGPARLRGSGASKCLKCAPGVRHWGRLQRSLPPRVQRHPREDEELGAGERGGGGVRLRAQLHSRCPPPPLSPPTAPPVGPQPRRAAPPPRSAVLTVLLQQKQPYAPPPAPAPGGIPGYAQPARPQTVGRPARAARGRGGRGSPSRAAQLGPAPSAVPGAAGGARTAAGPPALTASAPARRAAGDGEREAPWGRTHRNVHP